MKVQHDALNASCPNEKFYSTVPNDEQDRGWVLKGLAIFSAYSREISFKKHKAELEQSKNCILELKLVQHLQNSMKQKDFIIRLSQSIVYAYIQQVEEEQWTPQVKIPAQDHGWWKPARSAMRYSQMKL